MYKLCTKRKYKVNKINIFYELEKKPTKSARKIKKVLPYLKDIVYNEKWWKYLWIRAIFYFIEQNVYIAAGTLFWLFYRVY